jgi:hypothetical protein
LWGSFISGLAIQIHFTVVLFFISFIIAFLMEKEIALKERIKTTGFVIGAFFLPLLPYMIQQMIFVSHLPYSGFDAAVETFFNATHYTSYTFQDNIQAITGFLHYMSFELWLFPTLLCGIFLYLKLVRANRFLAVSFLMTLAMVPWVAEALGYNRYLIPMAICCSVVAGVLAPPGLNGKKSYFLFFFLLAILVNFVYRVVTLPPVTGSSVPGLSLLAGLIVVGFFFGFVVIEKKPVRLVFLVIFSVITVNAAYNKAQLSLPMYDRSTSAGYIRIKEGSLLLNTIIKTTGWSYDEFREKTYLQGPDVEVDFSFMYRVLSEKNTAKKTSDYDGVLVRTKLFTRVKVPRELENALSNGDISCAEDIELPTFDLCFYRFRDPLMKRRMQNIGYGYDFTQPPVVGVWKEKGVIKKNGNQAVFYWNQCPALQSYCSVYFDVKLLNDNLLIHALGDPLAAPVIHVRPDWSVQLTSPMVRVTCGEDVQNYKIAENLGFGKFASTFLAPYDTFVRMNCQSPSQITIYIPQARSAVRSIETNEKNPYEISWDRK